MDAIEAIVTRRSIRRYKPDAVGPEKVEILLRAAMQAPSSKNLQPWRFVVVTERALLDGFAAFHPHAAMLKEAPAGILVCGDRSAQPLDGYLALDCAAATQNLLLAAHALGLGAVWLGIYPREERIKETARLYGLPGSVLPIAMVAVGRPAEEKDPAQRYDPAKIHEEHWQGIGSTP